MILVSGMIRPRLFHLSFIQSTWLSSSSRSKDNELDITSFVISSSVGPNPPDVTTTSQLSRRYVIASCISFSLSEIVISLFNLKPASYNLLPKFVRLVFTVSPSNISVPTDRKPIFIFLD